MEACRGCYLNKLCHINTCLGYDGDIKEGHLTQPTWLRKGFLEHSRQKSTARGHRIECIVCFEFCVSEGKVRREEE